MLLDRIRLNRRLCSFLRGRKRGKQADQWRELTLE
jgi:hypothetical protein